jgi:ketosteroid isomerase-like protein
MLEIIGKMDIHFMGKRLRGPYMNLHVGTIASVFALILIQDGTGKADPPPSQQNAKGDVLTQEEALIAATLNNVANAETQFSKTKDAVSILRFYAQDYAGIKDGKSETVKDQKQYLAEVLEQINSDEPIGISSKVLNIKPSVTGRLGWAMYEYEYKVIRSGVLQRFSQGQCTAIFKKEADSWLIRHEHCSTASPTPIFLNPR